MFVKFRYALVLCALSNGIATDVTFFAISDLHYGKKNAPYFEESRQLMPTLLNALPGMTFPPEAGGGVVDTPRGVLVAGDMVDLLDSSLWKAYTEDYGVMGEKRLAFPTYEACGNHDFWAAESLKDTLYIVRSVRERNEIRKPFLTFMDSSGYHYSWDWDNVHFVNLNVYAGDTEIGYHGYRPLKAIQFLESDLAENVGESGRPVFIMQHFGFDSLSNIYWSDAMRTQMYNILKNYNIIGILHGHTHKRNIYKWNDIDVFDDGTALEMDALVFHITDGHMRVANRIHTGWGTNIFTKNISMGKKAVTRVGAKGRGPNPFSRYALTIPKAGLVQKIPANVSRLEILDLHGRRVQLLRSNGSNLVWNRLDSKGVLVPAGIYVLRDAVRKNVLGKIVLK